MKWPLLFGLLATTLTIIYFNNVEKGILPQAKFASLVKKANRGQLSKKENQELRQHFTTRAEETLKKVDETLRKIEDLK